MAAASVPKCYCGKPLKELPIAGKYWLCHRCWLLQTQQTWHQCGDCPGCDNAMGDSCFLVCGDCLPNVPEQKPADIDRNELISRKLSSALQNVRQYLPMYTGQGLARKYMYHVRWGLSRCWIFKRMSSAH